MADQAEAALLERHSHDESCHGASAPISIDDALELAGGWSTFQWRLLCCLGGCMAFASAHMLCPIFLIPRMMESWHLTAGASSLQASVFFAGYIAGVVLWAGISDRRGRRPATNMAFAIGNLSGIASFFAPSYATFVALRFVCGVGVAGAKNGCFLIATEFAPPNARARVGALISYLWLGGLLYLVVAAWVLRSLAWRWLVLAYVPGLVAQYLLNSLLPESPRFLLVAGEADRAHLVLLNIFRTNGRRPPAPMVLRRPPLAAAGGSGGREGGGAASAAASFCELWRRGLRLKSAIVGLCQGVCTMVFYAITFDPATNAASGNLYLGALLGALVELPAYALLAPATNRLGRRASYSAFLALSAAFLVAQHFSTFHAAPRGQSSHETHHHHHHHAAAAAAAAPDADAAFDAAPDSVDAASAEAGGLGASAAAVNWGAVVAALGGRFASVAAVNVAYIVSAESYPTSCRNSAVGWGTGCGRIGAMVAPVIMLSLPSPLLVFTALSLLCAALVWQLPETAGASLADVVGSQVGGEGAREGEQGEGERESRGTAEAGSHERKRGPEARCTAHERNSTLAERSASALERRPTAEDA